MLINVRFRRSESAGFTLIELLITIAILALLLALAAPGFSAFIKNTQIRTAAEVIQNGLQLARGEAIRRNVPVQFSLTSVVAGGGDTGASDWTVSVVGTGEVIQNRLAAEGSRNVSVTAAQPTVIFNGLGRANVVSAISVNPDSGSCSTFRCLNVRVSVGGQIRMCDENRPDGDPQKC